MLRNLQLEKHKYDCNTCYWFIIYCVVCNFINLKFNVINIFDHY